MSLFFSLFFHLVRHYVKPIALKFKINPEIPILHVVNQLPTNFQSKRGQTEILLRGYLVLVEKFSSNFFWENGLKRKFPIVWCDPERDLDLQDREVAFLGGSFSAQSLL